MIQLTSLMLTSRSGKIHGTTSRSTIRVDTTTPTDTQTIICIPYMYISAVRPSIAIADEKETNKDRAVGMIPRRRFAMMNSSVVR